MNAPYQIGKTISSNDSTDVGLRAIPSNNLNLSNKYSTKLSSSQEKISKLKAVLYNHYSKASGDTIRIEKREILEIIKEFSQVDELIYQVLQEIDND
ncbi:hypothetical protein H6G94_33695 [Nostoc punctiforme FACHB-252]|uniref:Uncharacterized protein n=1 Tax=Nostoc punctiforme FACHB-252 TaxID=1357509 RepID=A0ABR8HKM5_NOSPU|nr:hypothetical protein [Nostoc punctiforme]MBD2616142.1 hypothetical protein [Nostoc punctiforme FACHB-252]